MSTDRLALGYLARQHYETVWGATDPWDLESSPFEQQRFDRLLEVVGGRRYQRVLEIGCGAGAFTRRLATIADKVLALDIASEAITRAQSARGGSDVIEFRAANIMEFDAIAEGPWDLIVMTETIYSIGWLYSFFELGWLAHQLFESTREPGHLLLANTLGREHDWLLKPWLIYTYRDLFANLAYTLEREEMFRGAKYDIPLEVLISFFSRPAQK